MTFPVSSNSKQFIRRHWKKVCKIGYILFAALQYPIKEKLKLVFQPILTAVTHFVYVFNLLISFPIL